MFSSEFAAWFQVNTYWLTPALTVLGFFAGSFITHYLEFWKFKKEKRWSEKIDFYQKAINCLESIKFNYISRYYAMSDCFVLGEGVASLNDNDEPERQLVKLIGTASTLISPRFLQTLENYRYELESRIASFREDYPVYDHAPFDERMAFNSRCTCLTESYVSQLKKQQKDIL